MLAADGTFSYFGQVCLRLALEVQYLVGKFGVHQTALTSPTFIILLRQFFHYFCQRLNSRSTFRFDHFGLLLHNPLCSFFYLF